MVAGPHRSSQAERKTAARPLARQGELFSHSLSLSGNWCIMSLVCKTSVPYNVMCVHHLWPALQCSMPGAVCPCPLLAPTAPRRGGGTRPGEAAPAYVPAATALPYRHAAGMCIFMHIIRDQPPGCSVSIMRSTPSPVPWARGRSQNQRRRPSALAHGPRRIHRQNKNS